MKPEGSHPAVPTWCPGIPSPGRSLGGGKQPAGVWLALWGCPNPRCPGTGSSGTLPAKGERGHHPPWCPWPHSSPPQRCPVLFKKRRCHLGSSTIRKGRDGATAASSAKSNPAFCKPGHEPPRSPRLGTGNPGAFSHADPRSRISQRRNLFCFARRIEHKV